MWWWIIWNSLFGHNFVYYRHGDRVFKVCCCFFFSFWIIYILQCDGKFFLPALMSKVKIFQYCVNFFKWILLIFINYFSWCWMDIYWLEKFIMSPYLWTLISPFILNSSLIDLVIHKLDEIWKKKNSIFKMKFKILNNSENIIHWDNQ